MVVEGIDGHPAVELLDVVTSLRAEVVDLVVGRVAGLQEPAKEPASDA